MVGNGCVKRVGTKSRTVTADRTARVSLVSVYVLAVRPHGRARNSSRLPDQRPVSEALFLVLCLQVALCLARVCLRPHNDELFETVRLLE